MTANVAWFHCFAGIAGDMAFGALVDAGADLDETSVLLKRLPVAGWSVRAEEVLRGGIGATKLVVDTEETSVVRTYAHIVGLIEEARVPDRVRIEQVVGRCQEPMDAGHADVGQSYRLDAMGPQDRHTLLGHR